MGDFVYDIELGLGPNGQSQDQHLATRSRMFRLTVVGIQEPAGLTTRIVAEQLFFTAYTLDFF